MNLNWKRLEAYFLRETLYCSLAIGWNPWPSPSNTSKLPDLHVHAVTSGETDMGSLLHTGSFRSLRSWIEGQKTKTQSRVLCPWDFSHDPDDSKDLTQCEVWTKLGEKVLSARNLSARHGSSHDWCLSNIFLIFFQYKFLQNETT